MIHMTHMTKITGLFLIMLVLWTGMMTFVVYTGKSFERDLDLHTMLHLGVWLCGLAALLAGYWLYRCYLKAEIQALSEKELADLKYRTLFEESLLGLALVDAESGRVVECNKALAELLHSTPENILGAAEVQLFNPDEPGAQGFADLQEACLALSSGPEVWVELKRQKIFLPDKPMWLVSFRDIGVRVAFEKERNELLTLLNNLSRQIPGGIFQFEQAPDGRQQIRYASSQVGALFGLKEVESSTDLSAVMAKIHADDLQGLLFSINVSAINLSRWVHQFRVDRQDGRVCWLEGSSVPRRQEDGRIVWYGFVWDITDKKVDEEQRLRLEERLRQKEKMEIVGLLAGGIAHNFNNNLAIILGNLEMARCEELEVRERTELLDSAHIAARRASELIRQIMKFSRKEEQTECLDLEELMTETVTLLRSTMPSSLRIELHIAQSGRQYTVRGTAARIQDLLLNLGTNALHAMEEKGILSLALNEVVHLPEGIASKSVSRDGAFACISVEDTGSGMDEQTLAKIFDPFFTTKGAGKGTGLGLATVKSTVEQYRGQITVESQPGKGTRFNIYLPLLDGGHDCEEQGGAEGLPGTERVLIVDDEPLVGQLVGNMLRGLGYQITVLSDSQSALELFEKDPDAFDLLISDQVMPGLTGAELAERLRKLRAELPVILCTGYSADVSTETLGQFAIDALCYKPFGLAEISTAIRDVLDRAV